MQTILASGGNPLEFLTQFGVEWRLLVSQALSFAIVTTALYFFAFKPVMAMSDKRKAEIEKGLKDAAEARERLASAQAEADRKTAEAAIEATKTLERAREEAKLAVERAAAEATEKVAEIRRNAEAQIEKDRQQMRDNLKAELCTLVVKAAENAVNGILTPEQRAKLAENAADKLAE